MTYIIEYRKVILYELLVIDKTFNLTCVVLVDWDQFTPAEQNSVKNFLLERFAVDDLELAYDEFYPKYGKI